LSNKPEPLETKNTTIENDQPVENRRSIWLLIFSLVLAIVLLFFALRNVDWAAFWKTIIGGHYWYLLLIIPIASINYFIRAIRWSIFVSSERKIPTLSVFWANMVGYLGNAFLPARAGELLRSGFLGRKSGLGTSFVLATALVERILDAIFLVLIGSISLLWLGNIPPLLANAVRIMAIAGILVLAIIIIAPHQENLLLRLFGRLPLSTRISKKIAEQIARFLVGVRCLQNGRRLATFILLTVVIWLVDALGNIIGVRIVSQTLSLSQALILLSALGLSSAIPSTPGYIGVYQFVAVTILVPFGFSRPEALAYILISQVLGYVLVGFWGLLGLWQINRGKGIPKL
jgi:glycosyltransferase 2 family protein